ncbi:MAG: HAMP domain-containing sensor histidine kinase [Planctomycetota bacterium]
MHPEPDDLSRQRACSEFAHRARHELLTPLSGLTMLLSAARRGGSENDVEIVVDQALAATQRMTRVVRACVEYIDADLPLPGTAPVDTGVLCREAQEILRTNEPLFARAMILVRDPLPTVEGHAGMLRRVFMALLDNAVRYTRDVPARVEVSAVEADDRWRIEIADRGIGLSPEQCVRVLSPFERLHAWDSIPGIGLSLATCQRVMTRHRGQLALAARDGGGTVAWFTLPRP